MRTVRLRYVAEVNPQTPGFDALPDDAQVTFVPLEAVWPDSRLDLSRRRPKAEVSAGYVRFQQGDVLCPKVTPTFQAGRSALISTLSTPVGAASTEVHVVRVRPDADPRFVRYNLLTKPFLDEGIARFQGVAGLQRVPDDFLQDLPLEDLSFDRQRRIADFLDDQVTRIENIIAARRQQIDLFSRAALSEIDLLFAVSAHDQPSTRLGRYLLGIEQGWSPQCEALPADEDEWGVLKVSAVKDGRFIPFENKRLPDELAPQAIYEVRPNDLLVTRANTPALVGTFAVVPSGTRRRLIMCDKIMRLRLDPVVDPRYVALVARTSEARVHLSSAGTGTSQSMVNIRGDDIRDLRIPSRSLAEQRTAVETAQRFEVEVQRSSELLGAQIARLGELERSLITTAVTGEFDVTSADGSRVPA